MQSIDVPVAGFGLDRLVYRRPCLMLVHTPIPIQGDMIEKSETPGVSSASAAAAAAAGVEKTNTLGIVLYRVQTNVLYGQSLEHTHTHT